METIIEINYSYPTSPNASRFGFPNGCYTVTRFTPFKDSKGRDCYVGKALAAFATKAEAEASLATLSH